MVSFYVNTHHHLYMFKTIRTFCRWDVFEFAPEDVTRTFLRDDCVNFLWNEPYCVAFMSLQDMSITLQEFLLEFQRKESCFHRSFQQCVSPAGPIQPSSLVSSLVECRPMFGLDFVLPKPVVLIRTSSKEFLRLCLVFLLSSSFLEIQTN